MTNSENLLDKLRQNRQRSTVPSRNDALFSVQKNEEEPQPETGELTLEQLKARLAQFPQTQRRSGIVLEAGLDRQLSQFCKENKITVETFLEAAWQVAETDEALLEKIVVEAKRRYTLRKEAGQLRRLITSLKGIEA